ncbi:MAG: hypothetical protein EXR79_09570 [Myxococcales bacterium]|nr:hypothetical protein [Myxococcales bacterium]
MTCASHCIAALVAAAILAPGLVYAEAVAEPGVPTPTAGAAAHVAVEPPGTKLKFTGYVQGRFEWHADAHDGLDAGGKVQSTTQFLVRRARLKADATSTHGQAMLQIDATGKGVALKDAEASLLDTWTPAKVKLTVGQFKWPFGYEMVQSSGEREFPDRTRMWKAVFPGERDRGLRVQGQWGPAKAIFALVNGNGIDDALYLNNDPNAFKDVVGRLAFEANFAGATLAGGLSAYSGRSLRTTAAVAAKVGGKDADGDGKVSGLELAQTAAVPASNRRFDILRLGVDVQASVAVPHLGRLAVKGEGLFVRDRHAARGDVTPDAAKHVESRGWSLLVMQNLPQSFALLLRADGWDPDTAKDTDATTTLGGGLLWAPVPQAKLVAVYERPLAQALGTAAGALEALTVQVQGGF